MRDLKHILDAVDEHVAFNAFFHASEQPLPVGETLQHVGGFSYRGDDRLNAYRPVGVPARGDQFFMVQDPACLSSFNQSEQHLYRVEPQAPVTKADYGWAEKMFDVDDQAIFSEDEWRQQLAEGDSRRDYWDSIARDRIAAKWDAISQIAKRYWSGELSDRYTWDEGEPVCSYEWLTPSMKVVEEVPWPKSSGASDDW